jgi:hypothetical protein
MCQSNDAGCAGRASALDFDIERNTLVKGYGKALLLLALIFFSLAARAQVSNPSIITVTVAPSGSCWFRLAFSIAARVVRTSRSRPEL